MGRERGLVAYSKYQKAILVDSRLEVLHLKSDSQRLCFPTPSYIRLHKCSCGLGGD